MTPQTYQRTHRSQLRAISCLALLLCVPAGPVSGQEELTWQNVLSLENGVEVAFEMGRGVMGAERVVLEGLVGTVAEDGITLIVEKEEVLRISETGSERVLLTLLDGVEVEATCARSQDDGDVEVCLPREAIRMIRARTGEHHGRKGALIGMGAVVAGFTIWFMASDYSDANFGSGFLTGVMFSPAGALAGYYIGRTSQRWKTVYERPVNPAGSFSRNPEGVQDLGVDLEICLLLTPKTGEHKVLGSSLQRLACTVLAEKLPRKDCP